MLLERLARYLDSAREESQLDKATHVSESEQSDFRNWVLEEWRRLSIPEWRRILAESLEAGDVRQADYARWMLAEVLVAPEHESHEGEARP